MEEEDGGGGGGVSSVRHGLLASRETSLDLFCGRRTKGYEGVVEFQAIRRSGARYSLAWADTGAGVGLEFRIVSRPEYQSNQTPEFG